MAGPIVVITCKVMHSVLERLLAASGPSISAQVQILDYGLHRVPVKLTAALQEALDAIEQPSLVLLGYALCGNGLRGVAAGAHTLLVPRTDDCIAVLLGSYKAYMHQFGAVPGTIYLTKGWLEAGSHPLKEFHEYSAKYGEQEALWILDQQYRHYERLALVAPNAEEMAAYRPEAQEVARFCERWGMRYEEILGSDDYVRRLIETAIGLRDGTINPEAAAPDFLVIPPGGEIRQEMFLR